MWTLPQKRCGSWHPAWLLQPRAPFAQDSSSPQPWFLQWAWPPEEWACKTYAHHSRDVILHSEISGNGKLLDKTVGCRSKTQVVATYIYSYPAQSHKTLSELIWCVGLQSWSENVYSSIEWLVYSPKLSPINWAKPKYWSACAVPVNTVETLNPL